MQVPAVGWVSGCALLLVLALTGGAVYGQSGRPQSPAPAAPISRDAARTIVERLDEIVFGQVALRRNPDDPRATVSLSSAQFIDGEIALTVALSGYEAELRYYRDGTRSREILGGRLTHYQLQATLFLGRPGFDPRMIVEARNFQGTIANLTRQVPVADGGSIEFARNDSVNFVNPVALNLSTGRSVGLLEFNEVNGATWQQAPIDLTEGQVPCAATPSLTGGAGIVLHLDLATGTIGIRNGSFVAQRFSLTPDSRAPLQWGRVRLPATRIEAETLAVIYTDGNPAIRLARVALATQELRYEGRVRLQGTVGDRLLVRQLDAALQRTGSSLKVATVTFNNMTGSLSAIVYGNTPLRFPSLAQLTIGLASRDMLAARLDAEAVDLGSIGQLFRVEGATRFALSYTGNSDLSGPANGSVTLANLNLGGIPLFFPRGQVATAVISDRMSFEVPFGSGTATAPQNPAARVRIQSAAGQVLEGNIVSGRLRGEISDLDRAPRAVFPRDEIALSISGVSARLAAIGGEFVPDGTAFALRNPAPVTLSAAGAEGQVRMQARGSIEAPRLALSSTVTPAQAASSLPLVARTPALGIEIAFDFGARTLGLVGSVELGPVTLALPAEMPAVPIRFGNVEVGLRGLNIERIVVRFDLERATAEFRRLSVTGSSFRSRQPDISGTLAAPVAFELISVTSPVRSPLSFVSAVVSGGTATIENAQYESQGLRVSSSRISFALTRATEAMAEGQVEFGRGAVRYAAASGQGSLNIEQLAFRFSAAGLQSNAPVYEGAGTIRTSALNAEIGIARANVYNRCPDAQLNGNIRLTSDRIDGNVRISQSNFTADIQAQQTRIGFSFGRFECRYAEQVPVRAEVPFTEQACRLVERVPLVGPIIKDTVCELVRRVRTEVGTATVEMLLWINPIGRTEILVSSLEMRLGPGLEACRLNIGSMDPSLFIVVYTPTFRRTNNAVLDGIADVAAAAVAGAESPLANLFTQAGSRNIFGKSLFARALEANACR